MLKPGVVQGAPLNRPSEHEGVGPERAGAARQGVLNGHRLAVGELRDEVDDGAAAVGFARRGIRRDDNLMKWVAAGLILAGFARLDYFLFPSLYSDWVFIGGITFAIASVIAFAAAAFYVLVIAPPPH